MATNKEITGQIEALDENAVTEGLNKSELEALLVSLQPVAPPPPPEEAAKYEYHIAEGKAITTLRGSIGHGAGVEAKDFIQGEKDFKPLVDAGVILKGGECKFPEPGADS